MISDSMEVKKKTDFQYPYTIHTQSCPQIYPQTEYIHL